MKTSYNWLQTFFDTPLPPPRELEALLTLHSVEVDEVVAVGDDTVFEIKVLPDKSAWLFSHRGVAKEIATILGISLSHDPFVTRAQVLPVTDKLIVHTETVVCDYYSAALVDGVTVGPSPDWLKMALQAIGQRSINNVVDATNYVMFSLGQPLHAFDAAKLAVDDSGRYAISVCSATPSETITVLTGETHTLSAVDTVIVDAAAGNIPIGIAGIKGGLPAAVTVNTSKIVIEAAHFNRTAVRRSSREHKLRTDASARYENGVPAALAPRALVEAVDLIKKIAGGSLLGIATVGNTVTVRPPVTLLLTKLNSVLGLTLVLGDVTAVIDRFGYDYTTAPDSITVTPPWERDDICLPEDLIEEIGRMYGLAHIKAIAPPQQNVLSYNTRHYYAEQIRSILVCLGFSEIYTSSFRSNDVVHIKNALATDKSYLRSRLYDTVREAVLKNIPQRDVLGLSAIKVFEIGTIFLMDTEAVHVCLGVQTGTSYKSVVDDVVLLLAQQAVETKLGTPLVWLYTENGTSEFSLDDTIVNLPVPVHYDQVTEAKEMVYKAFSLFPSISRDIALWVPLETMAAEVESTLATLAGTLCVRITLFDTFIKGERTSLAFRLVFQSNEKTLATDEVDTAMAVIYLAVSERGWEVR
jgi:phenylalanyl-tRNA synthetase beta chain